MDISMVTTAKKNNPIWIGQFGHCQLPPAANPMENHDGFIMFHPHFYPFHGWQIPKASEVGDLLEELSIQCSQGLGPAGSSTWLGSSLYTSD